MLAGQVQNIHSQSGTSIVVNGDLTGKKYFIGDNLLLNMSFLNSFLEKIMLLSLKVEHK